MPDRLLHLEELRGFEVEHAGHDVRRERLHPPVEIAHVRVVEAPRGLQPVLRVRELRLQREEVLVRLELGVVLCNGEQLPEGGHERTLGGRLCGRGPGRAGRERPRPRDLLEHLALVRRVALHGLDQVRDQVVPAPQLGVDVRPRIADEVLLRDEAVVRDHECERDQHDHAEDDQQHGTHG